MVIDIKKMKLHKEKGYKLTKTGWIFIISIILFSCAVLGLIIKMIIQ